MVGLVLLGLFSRLPDLKLAFLRNEAYLEVSRVLTGTGSTGIARQALQELEGSDPVGSAWAQYRISEIEGLSGEEWYGAILGDPDYLHYLRAVGSENMDLAMVAYQAYPLDARAVGWVADVLLESDPERAIFYYQRATELNPQDDLNWRHLAELLEWREPEIAIEAAHEACRLNPVADGSCFREAYLAYRLGDWERCASSYEFLIERDSVLYPESWAQYVLALEYLGRSEEADYWFAEATQVAPADYAVLFERYAVSEDKVE